MHFLFFVKDQNCLSDWENPDDSEHETVHYVCKKNSACGMYISQAWDYLGTQHFGTDILAPYTFQLMYLSCQKTFRCQNKPKPLLTTVFFLVYMR